MEFSKKSERQSKQLKTSGNKGSGFSLEDNRVNSSDTIFQLQPVIQRMPPKAQKGAKKSIPTLVSTIKHRGVQKNSVSGVAPAELLTWVSSYLPNNYTSTGHNNGGNTVYDIGNGYWGYIDRSHGEIEVLEADKMKGTSLGVKTLTFDYDEEDWLILEQPTKKYKLVSVHEGALQTGVKTHSYNFKK